MWFTYTRQVLRRATANSWRMVVAHSLKQILLKLVGTLILLALLALYTQTSLAEDAPLFSDELTLILLAFATSAVLVVLIFGFQVIFVVPFELWRESLREREPAPEFVMAEEAGHWLYVNGSERLRSVLRSNVPRLWKSIADCGRSYVIEASKEAAFQLYGRREPGLPLEPINPTECDFSTFEQGFGVNDKAPMEIAVRYADLPSILAYYEEPGRTF